MTNAVKIQTSANLFAADRVLKVGKDLSSAISVKKSANAIDVLNKVKEVTTDAKASLAELIGKVENKHFDSVTKQVESLSAKLESGKLNSRDMKDTVKTITGLTSDVMKLTADITTGNVVGIPVDSAHVLSDALHTVEKLKGAAVKFDTYYKTHLKPLIKDMANKIIHLEKSVVGDFEHAVYWIGSKILPSHHKHDHDKQDKPDAVVPAHANEHALELLPTAMVAHVE